MFVFCIQEERDLKGKKGCLHRHTEILKKMKERFTYMAHIDTELKMHTGRRLRNKYKHDKQREISSYTKTYTEMEESDANNVRF